MSSKEEQSSLEEYNSESEAEEESTVEKEVKADKPPVQEQVKQDEKEPPTKLLKRVSIREESVSDSSTSSSSDEEEEEEEDEEVEEEEEDEEDEEDEDSFKFSYTSSVLSEVSFIWEDEIYKFEELYDHGKIDTIFKIKHPGRSDYFDQSGVDQYTAVCASLNIVPMTRLIKSLKTDEIDLSHRCTDGKNIRAMCGALEVNNLVTRLILKYNKLSPNECYFLGYVFLYNENILLLDLTGCRIGPAGLKLLIEFLGKNLGLKELILSKCNIQDEGMKLLGIVLMNNNAVKKLDLSYNNLADESGDALGMAFKSNTCVTDLNLRYNNLFDPVAMKPFYMSLANNPSISRLDLSWNGLSGVEMGSNIAKFLKKNQSIRHLDLSDNRLEGMAVVEIKRAVPKAKTLETLKMGKNPMSPEDSESLLNGVKANPSLTVLDLEDVWVKKSFLKIANKISQEREFEVKFGGVFSNYEVHGPDYAALILKRAQYEAQKPKKAKFKKDFGHLMWNLGDEPLTQNAFMDLVKSFKAKVNKQLYPELLKEFTIPKSQLIDVVAMRAKYLSLFPDSTPPPPKKKKAKTDRKKQKGKDKKKKRHKRGASEGSAEGEFEWEGEGFDESSEIVEEFFAFDP